MTPTSLPMNRRRLVQTLGAAATLGPFAIGSSQAQATRVTSSSAPRSPSPACSHSRAWR